MALSMYDLSVHVFTRGLGQLAHLLEKGLAHAKAENIDPATLVEARLAPDMFTLARQVQSASDASKLAVARIAGIAAPPFADTETTFEELQARISKTLDFFKTVDRSQLDGREAQLVVVKTRGHELNFTAERYLLQFALPNFFFHVTTAYGVLRNSGAPVGKLDYLGSF